MSMFRGNREKGAGVSLRAKAAIAAVVAVAVAIVGCTQPTPPTKHVHADKTSFQSGQAIDLQTTHDVTVYIPKGHLSGAGTITVTPTTREDGLTGFHIDLTGAKLTGTATIKIAHTMKSGEPAPIVGYSETATGSLHYDADVHTTSSGVTITTNHFSFWVLEFASDLLTQMSTAVNSLLSITAAAPQPTCPGAAEEKTAGITVTSSTGNRVYWCVGKAANGKPELTVVNARHYSVAVEATPGLSIQNADNSILDALPRMLVGLQARAGSKNDNMYLLQGGQSYTFTDTATTAQAVNITPNPGAYLADATMFALQTVLLVLSRGEGGAAKNAAENTISTTTKWSTFLTNLTSKGTAALNIYKQVSDCLTPVKEMNDADMTTAGGVIKYLNSALALSLDCMKPALNAADQAFASQAGFLLQFVNWLIQGVQLVINAGVAIVDTLLGGGGYQVTVTPPPPVVPTLGNVNGTEGAFGPEPGTYTFGFGSVKPNSFWNGGDPTGAAYDIKWTTWGGPTATGTGVAVDASVGIVADAPTKPTDLYAFDLGTCDGHLMYQKLVWWFPSDGDTLQTSIQYAETISTCASGK